MNIKTKFFLSVVIASLSALVFSLEVNKNNSKNEPVAVQTVVKSTENVTRDQPVSIKFEIDNDIEEMNQKMIEIESITDKKEWFLAYKKIVNEYAHIVDQPETIYDYFSEDELDLLFHVIQAEIGDEYSFEQKCNVASVIFNRLNHERFPNVLSEILTPDQFQPIEDGRYKEVNVSEDTILACEYVFIIGDTTDRCLFFDSNNILDYQFVFNDGAHNFYKYLEE